MNWRSFWGILLKAFLFSMETLVRLWWPDSIHSQKTELVVLWSLRLSVSDFAVSVVNWRIINFLTNSLQFDPCTICLCQSNKDMIHIDDGFLYREMMPVSKYPIAAYLSTVGHLVLVESGGFLPTHTTYLSPLGYT